MSSDTEMMEQIRRANPVPEPSQLHNAPDAAVTLFSSISRRTTMIDTPTRRQQNEPRPQWRRRPAFVFAIAALAVVAVIAPAVYFASRTDGVVADEEPVPPPTATVATTAAPNTTATPTTSAPVSVTPPAMEWARVASLPAFERAWMRAVTVGGPGLVAVGSTEQFSAAVWVSEDGLDWQRIEDESFLPGADAERFMFDVAAGPAGVIVLGAEYAEDEDHPGNGGLMWHSPDGISWAQVGDGSPFNDSQVNRVIAGGPGFVAVGEATSAGPSLPAIWFSADGRTWEAVTDESLSGLTDRDAWMSDVTEGGPGFVAVGCEEGEPSAYNDGWYHRVPGIWVSEDGASWDRLPQDAVVDPNLGLTPTTCPGRVVATDSGFVALGDWGDRTWISNDGLTWTMSANFETPDAHSRGPLAAVVAAGDSVVAGGWEKWSSGPAPGGGDFTGSAAFWVIEPETSTWFRVGRTRANSRVGVVPTENMNYMVPGVVDDLVEFGSVVIAVGHDGTYLDELDEALDWNWCGLDDSWPGACRTDAAVWIGTWLER